MIALAAYSAFSADKADLVEPEFDLLADSLALQVACDSTRIDLRLVQITFLRGCERGKTENYCEELFVDLNLCFKKYF